MLIKQTKNDVYGLHTALPTEGDLELDHPLGEQIPYCEHWQTVWQISDGDEFTIVLGDQQWPLHNPVGEPGLFSNIESTEGIDAGHWWEWNSGF